ncbi:hypothetical protein HY411_01735, partial [Candidatus Gottesmanbacteria bacterium]|nr:hypothetical protein [Candidatus Gottesmanbacteria bacterium]
MPISGEITMTANTTFPALSAILESRDSWPIVNTGSRWRYMMPESFMWLNNTISTQAPSINFSLIPPAFAAESPSSGGSGGCSVVGNFLTRTALGRWLRTFIWQAPNRFFTRWFLGSIRGVGEVGRPIPSAIDVIRVGTYGVQSHDMTPSVSKVSDDFSVSFDRSVSAVLNDGVLSSTLAPSGGLKVSATGFILPSYGRGVIYPLEVPLMNRDTNTSFPVITVRGVGSATRGLKERGETFGTPKYMSQQYPSAGFDAAEPYPYELERTTAWREAGLRVRLPYKSYTVEKFQMQMGLQTVAEIQADGIQAPNDPLIDAWATRNPYSFEDVIEILSDAPESANAYHLRSRQDIRTRLYNILWAQSAFLRYEDDAQGRSLALRLAQGNGEGADDWLLWLARMYGQQTVRKSARGFVHGEPHRQNLGLGVEYKDFADDPSGNITKYGEVVGPYETLPFIKRRVLAEEAVWTIAPILELNILLNYAQGQPWNKGIPEILTSFYTGMTDEDSRIAQDLMYQMYILLKTDYSIPLLGGSYGMSDLVLSRDIIPGNRRVETLYNEIFRYFAQSSRRLSSGIPAEQVPPEPAGAGGGGEAAVTKAEAWAKKNVTDGAVDRLRGVAKKLEEKCPTGLLPTRPQLAAQKESFFGRTFDVLHPDVVKVQNDRDEKQDRERRTATEDIFQQFWRYHTDASFRNTMANHANDIPITNARPTPDANSYSEAVPSAAGVMRITANHPAARLVHNSDNTTVVAARLPFINFHSTIRVPAVSTNVPFFPPAFASSFGLARRAYAADPSNAAGQGGGAGLGCAAARAVATGLRAAAPLVKKSYSAPSLVALRA